MFSFAFSFLAIGYAALTDDLEIEGEASGFAQTGVFITDVTYDSNNNAQLNNSTINYMWQTNLSSTIALSTNKNSSITYEVTIYNSNDYDTAFDGINYLKDDGTQGTYSNKYIQYSFDGLSEGQILKSKEKVTFKITFSYTYNAPYNCSNILNSLLNFKYPRIYYVTYENFTSTAGYSTYVVANKELTVDFGSMKEPIQVTQASSKTMIYEENYDDTISVSSTYTNQGIHFRRMRECHVVTLLNNGGFETGTHHAWGIFGNRGFELNPIQTSNPPPRNGTYRSCRMPDPTNTEHKNGYHYLYQIAPLIQGHKYYYFGYAKTDGSNQNFSCDIQNVPGSAFTVVVNGDGWKKGDVIFTAPSTGNFNVAVNFAYNSEKIYHYSYGLFDLTAAFGAGQEPPYQWCHDNLGYYSEDKAYDIKYR